jgi:nucleoside-diphosphate-sugar epimerase
MKNILVTGAGGFIGLNLCEYLNGRGHNVIGIDLKFPGAIGMGGNAPFRQETCDFREPAKMKKLLAGIDGVIHLAAAHLQINQADQIYWDVNVHSLKPLLKMCADKGVQRFIHASSVAVYGDLVQLPANEDTAPHPQSIYGETKLAGETTIRRAGHALDLPTVIIRPAWVFGTGCPRTLKLYRALKNKRFPLIGPCQNKRHPLYIKDMARFFELTLHESFASGDVFLAGGETSVSTRELLDTYCRVLGLPRPKVHIPYFLGVLLAWFLETLFSSMGKEPPFSRRSLEFFQTNNAFDISKAKVILGFKPQYDLTQGLTDCRAWLQEKG